MIGAVASAAPNPVGVAPGSTIVSPIPNGSISFATVSQNPSTPHFDAW